jgi:hypothetical protein
MDDEPRRLVDDEEVLVLVRDVQVHRLRLERRHRRLRGLELELLAAGELVALLPRASVDEDAALAQQPLGDRAGADLGQRSEEAVEPGARRVVRNADVRGAALGPRRRA